MFWLNFSWHCFLFFCLFCLCVLSPSSLISLLMQSCISFPLASRSLSFLSVFLHLIFSNAHPARFLFPIVQSANLFPSHVLSDHPEGGQADGAAGRRWPRLPAPQVCLLPEGHRAHVPVPFPRKDHPVSSQCHSYISTHHFRVAVVSPSD